MTDEQRILSRNVLLAYIEDIKRQTGMSTYAILKKAGLPHSYVNNIKTGHVKPFYFVSLPIILLLHQTTKIPFDSSKYL